ncbi:AfsR/SARP family transcriptional regulator [Streptomyces sp. 7R007]
MEIKVLGPLMVRERGMSIVPSAGKPRQILAVLALRAGRVVPAATLMEEIWGQDIPRSAATTLQTYILQLRRKIATALGDAEGVTPKDVLVTNYGGYLLKAAAQDSDLREFERLSAAGGAALERGEARAAADLLARALGLWRGAALADVPVGPVLGLDLVGMEEARMRALEQRIEADLAVGRHATLLAELRMLVERFPMQESLVAHLMLALHRSGSTWRALEAFQRLRGTLVEELGIEPSARLQDLHGRMLAGCPSLDLPEDAGYGVPARLSA